MTTVMFRKVVIVWVFLMIFTLPFELIENLLGFLWWSSMIATILITSVVAFPLLDRLEGKR